MSFSETFKPGDLVVIAVIATVAFLWSSSGGNDGESPENLRIVTSEGEDTLSLFTDTVIQRGEVTIEISAGRAAITESNCPTHQCVRTGWIQNPRQMSACMPNGIFIEVIGSHQSTDAVTY